MSYRNALHGPTAVDYTRPQGGARKTTGASAVDISTVVGASASGIAAIIAAITGRSGASTPTPTATPEATGPDYASMIEAPNDNAWVLPAAIVGGVALIGVLALMASKKKKPVTANRRRRRAVRRNARRVPRVGTRVRFDPNPASLAMYGYAVPREQEEGTVTTVAMPGGRTHHLKGPGGGLVYVNWDQSGFIGVSLWDVMPLNQSKQVNWGGRFVKGGGRVKRNKKRDPLQVVYEPAFQRYAVVLEDEVLKRFAERDEAHRYADKIRSGGAHVPMTYQQSQPGVVANRRRRRSRR